MLRVVTMAVLYKLPRIYRQHAWEEEHITIARLLLDYGADVNLKGGEYGSALRAARDAGDEDMVRLLLENEARD